MNSGGEKVDKAAADLQKAEADRRQHHYSLCMHMQNEKQGAISQHMGLHHVELSYKAFGCSALSKDIHTSVRDLYEMHTCMSAR